MATAATVQMRIVKNGGPITSDVYKAYYSDGTSASEDWVKGEMLYLDAGYIKRIGTYGTADTFTTAGDSFNAAYKRFVALEDHDASDYTAANYVAVQEIMSDTVLELQLAASGSTSPTISAAKVLAGDPLGAYLSATGVWGLDVDENSAGFLTVVAYASDYNWMKCVTTTTGVQARCLVQLISTIIL